MELALLLLYADMGRDGLGMIIAKRYTVLHCDDGRHFKIKNKDAPLCPSCGVLLSGYDTRLRHCIGVDGEIRWFKLRRLRCPSCRKLHLELPDFMEICRSKIITGMAQQ